MSWNCTCFIQIPLVNPYLVTQTWNVRFVYVSKGSMQASKTSLINRSDIAWLIIEKSMNVLRDIFIPVSGIGTVWSVSRNTSLGIAEYNRPFCTSTFATRTCLDGLKSRTSCVFRYVFVNQCTCFGPSFREGLNALRIPTLAQLRRECWSS